MPLRNRFALPLALALPASLLIHLGCRTPSSGAQTKDAAALADSRPLSQPSARQMGKESINGLLDSYSSITGLWKGIGWWNSANSMEVVIDYSRLTGTIDFKKIITTTYGRHYKGSFLNEFNDDAGWWALAWIKAYDLTRQPKFLNTAETIFTDIARHWDDHCGGGVWWKNDHKYKNAITNELFLTLASRLSLRSSDKSQAAFYRNWAEKTWAWFEKSTMIRNDFLIADGLNENCHGVGQTFTYNQGVILGGLVDFATLTGNSAVLDKTHAVATAAITKLVDSGGILRDDGELPNSDNPDQPQFKGIFVRNLAYLYRAHPRPEYRQFILHNLAKVWSSNRSSAGSFGYLWAGPFDKADASRQTSGMDLINAAIAVSEPNVALGSKATANITPCAEHETAAMAVDGSLLHGSKWCGHGDPTAILTVDLKRTVTINSFIIKHAASGGEAEDFNTDTFSIETSEDGSTWSQAVFVTDNTNAVTDHPVPPRKARYARLNVLKSQTRQSLFASRIYEFEVISDGL